MSKKKLTPEEKQQKKNKIAMSLLVLMFVIAFMSESGHSISDSDSLHYLGKSYQYIQANVGQPNNIQTLAGGQRWQYDGFYINYQGSGYVTSVEISSKALKVGGCAVGDSLKSVESAMKKLDGGLISSQADTYYTFSFKHDGRSYQLGCVVEGNDVTMLSIAS